MIPRNVQGYSFGNITVSAVAFQIRQLVRIGGKLLPDSSAVQFLGVSYPGSAPLNLRRNPDNRIALIHQGPTGTRFEVVSEAGSDVSFAPPPLAENIHDDQLGLFRSVGERLSFCWEAPTISCSNYRDMSVEDYQEMMKIHHAQWIEKVRAEREARLERVLEQEHAAIMAAEESRARVIRLAQERRDLQAKLAAARAEAAHNLDAAAEERLARMSSRARRRAQESAGSAKVVAVPDWLLSWQPGIAVSAAPDVSVLAKSAHPAPAAKRTVVKSLADLAVPA